MSYSELTKQWESKKQILSLLCPGGMVDSLLSAATPTGLHLVFHTRMIPTHPGSSSSPFSIRILTDSTSKLMKWLQNLLRRFMTVYNHGKACELQNLGLHSLEASTLVLNFSASLITVYLNFTGTCCKYCPTGILPCCVCCVLFFLCSVMISYSL